MPITGRSLAGAGLMGLGEGLQQWSAQTIKRKQIEDEWKFELYKQQQAQAADFQNKQAASAQNLITQAIANPERGNEIVDAYAAVDPYAKGSAALGVPGLNLDALRQGITQRGLEALQTRIATAKTGLDLPSDVGADYNRVTGTTGAPSIPIGTLTSREPQLGTVERNVVPSPPPDPLAPPPALAAEPPQSPTLLPDQPMPQIGVPNDDRFNLLPPQIRALISGVQNRQTQQQAEEEDQIQRAGQLEQSKESGKKTGELTAAHTFAPQVASDAAAQYKLLTPLEVDRAGQTALAQETAKVNPLVITGKADEAGQTEAARLAAQTSPTNIAGQGTLAGAKKAAEDRAAAAVKFDPANMANEVTLAVNKASALAKAKGDTARQKYITDAQVGVLRLAPQLAVAKDLYDRAIKGDYGAAKLYVDKVKSLAAPIAMATGYTGRMTVQEMQNVSGLLPSLAADTVLGTADEKWNNLAATMRYGPLIASQLPEGATVSDALAAVQGLVDQEKQARMGRGTMGPPAGVTAPLQPGTTVTVPRPGTTLNRRLGTP